MFKQSQTVKKNIAKNRHTYHKIENGSVNTGFHLKGKI